MYWIIEIYLSNNNISKILTKLMVMFYHPCVCFGIVRRFIWINDQTFSLCFMTAIHQIKPPAQISISESPKICPELLPQGKLPVQIKWFPPPGLNVYCLSSNNEVKVNYFSFWIKNLACDRSWTLGGDLCMAGLKKFPWIFILVF